MSEYLWIVWVVVVIVSPPLLAFLFFSYLRAKRLHSKKKAEEQEKLDKKRGASTGTQPARQADADEKYKKIVRNVLIVFGVIIALFSVVWLWPSATPSTPSTPSVPGTGWSWSPTPSGVWEFTKDYWFWAIIGLALLFFASNALHGAWAKGAKGMVIIVAVVLVGAMIVHGIWGEGSSSQQTPQRLAKPMLKMPPNGDSDRISPDAGQVVIFTGDGFEHHVMYADGNDCIVGNVVNPCKDGPILHQYVRDTTGKPNSVTYKFVR